MFEAQSLTHLSLFFAHDVQVCYGTAVEHRSRLGVCWIDLVFCDRINCSNIFLFIQPFWVLKTAFNWVNIHLLFNIMLLIQWSVNVFVGHVVILLVEDQLSPTCTLLAATRERMRIFGPLFAENNNKWWQSRQQNPTFVSWLIQKKSGKTPLETIPLYINLNRLIKWFVFIL